MSESTPPFHATLISPEAQLLDTDVTSVQIPAHDGSIGLLTRRAPLLTKLGTGVLTLHTGKGAERFVVSGGYAQMKDNTLTILTEEAFAESAVTAERIATEQTKLTTITGNDRASMEERQKQQARLAALRELAG